MTIKDESAFARSVASGEAKACKSFVNEYSPLILSRIRTLMRTHCSYPAREAVCSLSVMRREERGVKLPLDIEQCDECMDSYLWFFDFLKKKVKAYKGTNNCTLNTFVWSLINSHTTYIEWLRWRYGRAY